MATISAERPRFFEGQYLGAEELTALVDYLRTSNARQNLGQHSWGIVIGLQLVSQSVSETAVEYYVQPGVAVDGYGRIIVVNKPTRIEADQFVSIRSGNVDVWIRYDESDFSATRPGFNTCSATDEYLRVSESFKILVGDKRSILDRESGVTVNDTPLVDAREALTSVDPDQQLLCDASVPHQQFPVDDEEAYWLIPLGHVKWLSASNSFLPLVDAGEVEDLENGSGGKTPDQVYEALMSSRSKRRMLGVVAESVLAADGLIRLRERGTGQDASGDNDAVCNPLKVQNRDLHFCEGRLKPKELVWLEGNVRIKGDARLLDGRLEFRDGEGRDYVQRTVDGSPVSPITPALIQRSNGNSKGGVDLQVLMGKSDDGVNRFAIGSVEFDGADLCDLTVDTENKVVIQDNGRVGIGTRDNVLESPYTVRGLEQTVVENAGMENETSIPVYRLETYESVDGIGQWELDLLDTDDSERKSLSFTEPGLAESRFCLEYGGDVGIGTRKPEAKLDIAQVSVGSDNPWLRAGDGGDAGRFWVEYGSQMAPLLVLSDDDDPPRMQFQQTGSNNPQDDTSPAHSSWIGHAGRRSPDLSAMGGNFGIGTDEPDAQLTVQANGGGARFYSGRNAGHFWLGFYTDGTPGSSRSGWLGYGSNGTSDFTIYNEKANGDINLIPERNVGIGTSQPDEKLEVRGNIKLGPSGEFHAVSAGQRMHTVAGRINANGTIGQGTGFSISPPHVTGSGEYTILFSPAFAAMPVVVACPFGHTDNVVSVTSVNPNRCVITCYDVLGSNSGPQDIAFTFIAVGER